MLGAIAGDIIGSVFEQRNIKTTDFPLFSPDSRFTDDTVLTLAVADSIMHGRDYASTLKEYTRRHPGAGYGGLFLKWALSDSREPYNSYGNGSAMRVSPVGFAFDNLKTVLAEAEKSAAVTHNHPEGIKGAQAVAAAVFMARQGQKKKEIKAFITGHFGYNLEQSLAEIRPLYRFDASCQGSVPQALIAFLEAVNYEDAVRRAISIGGDSDTIACMAGAAAEAYFGKIPAAIENRARALLPTDLLRVVDEFYLYCGLG